MPIDINGLVHQETIFIPSCFPSKDKKQVGSFIAELLLKLTSESQTSTPPLKILRLSGIHLDDSLIHSLPTLLSTCGQLAYLDISHCKLDLASQDSLLTLFNAFKKHPTLLGINLSYNYFSLEGLKSLLKTVESNKQLIHIGLYELEYLEEDESSVDADEAQKLYTCDCIGDAVYENVGKYLTLPISAEQRKTFLLIANYIESHVLNHEDSFEITGCDPQREMELNPFRGLLQRLPEDLSSPQTPEEKYPIDSLFMFKPKVLQPKPIAPGYTNHFITKPF